MMSYSEKLCLQWNDFKENVASSFGNLKEDKDLSDVTLVCEDGQQVEAHKVVLALSSPFFKGIFKSNKHPHPLIYMRGLKSEDLRAILDFLYNGTANVFQENLDSFLSLAGELKLKGLTRNEESQKHTDMTLTQNNLSQIQKQNLSSVPNLNFDRSTSTISNPTVAQRSKIKLEVGNLDLDEQIKSMITKSEVNTANGQGSMATCNICGKEGPYKAMPRHVETYHMEGVTHACDFCGKVSR